MKRKITIDRRPRVRSPWLVIGFCLCSWLALASWWTRFLSPSDIPALLLTSGTIGMPTLGLAWSAYRLEQSEIDPDRYARPVTWCLGGAVGFLAVTLPTMLIFPWHDPQATIAWAHFAVTAGAVGGFTVGYIEARAVQQEVEATAAAVRADQLAEERKVLTYLNDLLRHEVLNSAQIIGGHASLLLENPPSERRRDRLETIRRESEALEAVIDDIRVMLDANANPDQSAVVDLSELLEETIAAVRTAYDVELDATVPESIAVRGNDGIKRIFANVLENAIVHNDSGTPRVDLTVETTPDTVTVTVSDNGPGIPPEARDTLFERKSSNHGLGLYLVRILTNRYGGSVELTETGSDGSTFTVTLPRAMARAETDADVERPEPTATANVSSAYSD